MSHSFKKPARNPSEQLKLDAAIRDLFEHKIRFDELLGLRAQLDPPSLSFDMRAELIGHHAYGRLHGGVICSVLDTTGGMALMTAYAAKHPGDTADEVMHRFLRMGTIDIRVDFLRPGIGKHFIANASVTRLGGRIGSTRMEMHNDLGTLIATGSASYVVS